MRATMSRLEKDLPPGIAWSVVQTPPEAILLVVSIVVEFLQTWRASIIPLLAVS